MKKILLSLAVFLAFSSLSFAAQPWFTNFQSNSSNPNPLQSVMHNATVNDGVGMSGYIFSWNGTYCNATMYNYSWVAFTQIDANISVTKEVPGVCEGKFVGWIIYANNSAGEWNATDLAYGRTYYFVANVSPTVSAMAANVTKAGTSGAFCTNATVTDVGIGVSVVWQAITFPNGTVANITLQNSTSTDGCGGGGSTWSQKIAVGTTTGSFYVNTTWANDSLGNVGVLQHQLNLTAHNPPFFPRLASNSSNPNAGSSVMHNATIATETGDSGLSGYIFSWNGTYCNATMTNESWVAFSTNNTNASVTKTVYGACESRFVGWKIYANSSAGVWNESALKYYFVGNVSPVIASMAVNVSTQGKGAMVCTNASVSDAGVGVSEVWQVVTFANGTVANISLQNSTEYVCGGGGTTWSQKITIDDILGYFYVNTTAANDTLGNNATTLNTLLTVQITEPENPNGQTAASGTYVPPTCIGDGICYPTCTNDPDCIIASPAPSPNPSAPAPTYTPTWQATATATIKASATPKPTATPAITPTALAQKATAQQVADQMKKVNSLMAQAKQKGLDVSYAQRLINAAQNAMSAGDYQTAIEYANQAESELNGVIAASQSRKAGGTDLVLIGIVALLVLGGGYYYFFMRNKKKGLM